MNEYYCPQDDDRAQASGEEWSWFDENEDRLREQDLFTNED